MIKGWEVEYENGNTINEEQAEWTAIPKFGIKRLTLHFNGRRWDLTDKMAYFQRKRASMVPGVQASFRVEARTIGYYDQVDGKACKVSYTVDESTGNMKMEVKHIDG